MNSQIEPTPYVNETERELTENYECLCVNSRGTERHTQVLPFPFSPLPWGGRSLGLGLGSGEVGLGKPHLETKSEDATWIEFFFLGLVNH